MASTRKQIVDAFVDALEDITGIGEVTQDYEVWVADKPREYPKILVDAQKPEVERAYFLDDSAEDMAARMEVRVLLRTWSRWKTRVAVDVDDVMQDIEQAIVADATLAGLVIDVRLESDEIDVGSSDHLGFSTMVFVVEYEYNHNTP